ncbi:MAG: hypothetical protein ACTIBX_10685 [Staphylococcus saprophyticus]
MEQVYLYDGTPFLLYKNENDEYVYPSKEWTEIPPPNGIYSPFYFDGEKWIGTKQEDWVNKANVEEKYQPTNAEITLGQSQLQIAKYSFRINKLEKMLGDALLEIAKLKGEN